MVSKLINWGGGIEAKFHNTKINLKNEATKRTPSSFCRNLSHNTFFIPALVWLREYYVYDHHPSRLDLCVRSLSWENKESVRCSFIDIT
jgi:hypothetical protein